MGRSTRLGSVVVILALAIPMAAPGVADVAERSPDIWPTPCLESVAVLLEQ